MFPLQKWDVGGEEGTRLVMCNLPTILCTACATSKPHPLLHSRKGLVKVQSARVNKFLSAQVASIHLYQTFVACSEVCGLKTTACTWSQAEKSGSSSWSRCNWGAAPEPVMLCLLTYIIPSDSVYYTFAVASFNLLFLLLKLFGLGIGSSLKSH